LLPAVLAWHNEPAIMREPATGDVDPWAFVARVGEGASQSDAALDLARWVVRAAGAERAFVVLEGERSQKAWGVDLDGLPIGDAAQRVPADVVAAARARGLVHQGRVATAGGEGARLGVSARTVSGAAVVVVEHRFVPGRFDAVDEASARVWATCASLLSRLEPAAPAGPVAAVPIVPPRAALDPATLQPLRESTRTFPGIAGESVALRRALGQLDAAIDGDLPVLVVGETGTGKELFARALHEQGPRARATLCAVNCAAIPDSLFEAELFGHARGSFTGADRMRPGLYARAEGGTLFLDEIGELSLARQATLLRVLETRKYRPVGSDEERAADVRIVAATNRDLAESVRLGTFRQDLLYRLDVLRVRVPPLRERSGDVPLLLRRFLSAAGVDVEVAPRALARLSAYAWPGNVRELSHLAQRLAALRLDRIDVAHLPREIRAAEEVEISAPDRERAEVESALSAAGGNISHAAVALGLTRHGLKKRMVRLGMREPRGKSGPS
jgi:MoxR-like ATPase